MRRLFFIKVPSAIISTILPIYLLSIGFNNVWIGLANALSILASFLASTYFSLRAMGERGKYLILSFPLEVITVSIISLVFLKEPFYIFISIFLFNFYYNAYLYFLKVYLSLKGDVRDVQSKFEFFGGIFYVVGLLIGVLLSNFLDERGILLLSAVFPLIGIISLKRRVLSVTMMEFFERWSTSIEEDILQSLRYLRRIRFPGKKISLLIFSVLLADMLFESQFQIFLQSIGLPFSLIFLVYFLRSSLDIISYRIACFVGKKHIKILTLFGSFLIFLPILRNPLLSSLSKILFSLYFGVFSVYFDAFVLEKSKRSFGGYIVIKNLAGVFGSYLTGVIINFFSFEISFAIAGVLLLPTFLLI